MKERISVGVNYSFPATHNWPEAGPIAGEEVGFLAHEHRHTFHVKVEIETHHLDRDIEFFILQRVVREVVDTLYGPRFDGIAYRLGRRSCEQIAKELYGELQLRLVLHGDTQISVSEDNEVWATYRVSPGEKQ